MNDNNEEDISEEILEELEYISKIPIPSWKINLLLAFSKLLNIKIAKSYPYRWKYNGKMYGHLDG